MKCYMFSWDRSAEGINRQDILDFLDTLSHVKNWKAVDGTILIVSEAAARQISDDINTKFKELRHLITPISIEQIEGLTDADTWNFIRNPRSVEE